MKNNIINLKQENIDTLNDKIYTNSYRCYFCYAMVIPQIIIDKQRLRLSVKKYEKKLYNEKGKILTRTNNTCRNCSDTEEEQIL